MKHFNKCDCCNHSSLLEVTRKNLVGKTKTQSPERVQRSKEYSPYTKSSKIDIDKLIYDDVIVVSVPVGKYVDTIEFDGFLRTLINMVKQQAHGNVNLQVVTRALQKVADGNIRVDCTCADWQYRYRYWATRYGYAYGTPETRPAKIRNPRDDIGAMCKHLTSVLNNKRWMVQLASKLNYDIQTNIDEIRKRYKLAEDEFYVQKSGVNLRYQNKDNPKRGQTTDEE